MGKTVLVVDNNPVILRLVSHILQEAGYEVRTAVDGLMAIKAIETATPDIVITDLIMPNISGDKLCQLIRKRPEFDDIFIIVLSAIAAEESVDFRSFGADACIAKGPVKEMSQNILAVFQRHESREHAALADTIIGRENVHARQITKELLVTKRNFEITLENMADGFISLTPDGQIISLNPVATTLLNAPEEELVATSLFEHFPEQQQALLNAGLQRGRQSPFEIGEQEPLLLHGRYLLIKIFPVFDQELRSVIALISDITKRKSAELELANYRLHLEDLVATRAAELEEINQDLKEEIHERRKTQEELIQNSRQWFSTFNTIRDFVSVHDMDMKIIRVNKSMADFLGKDPDELIGRFCFEVMHARDSPWPTCPHLETIQRHETVTCEINDPHIGRPLLVTCSPYYDEHGTLIGTVHVARDISQQKKAEKEKENLIHDLQKALAQVKQLSGFLPICSSCKKIRDDQGYWNQIEAYIRDHSEAEFSHSICPDCAKKLYPDFDLGDE